MEAMNNYSFRLQRDNRLFHNSVYWRVIAFYILLPLVTASITLILELGHLSFKWLVMILGLYLLVSYRRIIQDLYKPKEILLYEDSIRVILSLFKWTREWTIPYRDLSVVCIGYEAKSQRSRVVIQNKLRISQGCSLCVSSGWGLDLQSVFLKNLEIITHITPVIKS